MFGTGEKTSVSPLPPPPPPPPSSSSSSSSSSGGCSLSIVYKFSGYRQLLFYSYYFFFLIMYTRFFPLFYYYYALYSTPPSPLPQTHIHCSWRARAKTNDDDHCSQHEKKNVIKPNCAYNGIALENTARIINRIYVCVLRAGRWLCGRRRRRRRRKRGQSKLEKKKQQRSRTKTVCPRDDYCRWKSRSIDPPRGPNPTSALLYV